MVLEADGRVESAQRDAQARERLALAEARAVDEVSKAIAGGSAQAVNYFVAQKYVESFKALAESPNQKLVLMPMEVTNIVSSIAGISEVVKEAFDGKSGVMVEQKQKAAPKKSSVIPDSV
jgi:regulator of protease activity HflC (stomatin/prohibitin superfamily)